MHALAPADRRDIPVLSALVRLDSFLSHSPLPADLLQSQGCDSVFQPHPAHNAEPTCLHPCLYIDVFMYIVCVYVCEGACMQEYTCVRKPKDNLRLGAYPNRNMGRPENPFPSLLGLHTCVYHCPQLFFTWVLGLRLRFSLLHGKHLLS